jgi:rhodanese-related sulfurtransferase
VTVLTLAALVFAGSVLSGAFTQGAAPTTRRYLSDQQWAEIGKMPETEPSKLVPAADIEKLLAADRVPFLDVREPQEVQDLGTIPGHVNIPFLQLQRRMGELPKDKVILTACNTGTGRAPSSRGAAAETRILSGGVLRPARY